MKAREHLLELMREGMLIGTLSAFAYTLFSYQSVTGLSLKEISHIYDDNTLWYLAIGFYMLWFISMFYYYNPYMICRKYGVDVIK